MTSRLTEAMLAIALVAIACRPEPAAPSSTTVPVVEGKAQDREEPPQTQGPELVHLGGSIDAGGGIKLEYFAVLERGDDGKYTGRLDIPMQGARGVALDAVEVTDTRITFTLPSVKAKWIATAARDDALACNFEQMGVSLPCRIERLTPEALATATAPKARPQTPKPPFPYEAIEVAYDNAEAGVHLAGTLTIPPGEGPVAAALLIT